MLINGLTDTSISANDRGLHYGDGVFETVRRHRGHLPFLQRHLARLTASCERLAIPLDLTLLQQELSALLSQAPPDAIIKIVITRGSGGRGYRPPRESAETLRLLQVHPLPAALRVDPPRETQHGVRVRLCHHTLSTNPATAGLKHLNRLDQVLASNEIAGYSDSDLDQGFDEGLMMTADGDVVEGIRSNLFIVREGEVLTPDLVRAGVAGIVRGFLLERLPAEGLKVTECRPGMNELTAAEEVFLCNSVFGVWPVIKLVENATVHSWSIGPVARKAIELYQTTLTAHDNSLQV